MIFQSLFYFIVTLAIPQEEQVLVRPHGLARINGRAILYFDILDLNSKHLMFRGSLNEGESLFGAFFVDYRRGEARVWTKQEGFQALSPGGPARLTFNYGRAATFSSFDDHRWRMIKEMGLRVLVHELVHEEWLSRYSSLYFPDDGTACSEPIRRPRSEFESRWLNAVTHQGGLFVGHDQMEGDLTREAYETMREDASYFFDQFHRIKRECRMNDGSIGVCCSDSCELKKEIQRADAGSCQAIDACGEPNAFYNSLLNGHDCENVGDLSQLQIFLPGLDRSLIDKMNSGQSVKIIDGDQIIELKSLASLDEPFVSDFEFHTAPIQMVRLKGRCLNGNCIPLYKDDVMCTEPNPRFVKEGEEWVVVRSPLRDGSYCGPEKICQQGRCVTFRATESRLPRRVKSDICELPSDIDQKGSFALNGKSCPFAEDEASLQKNHWRGFCHFGDCLLCDESWPWQHDLACPDLPKALWSVLTLNKTGQKMNCRTPDVCSYFKK